MSLLSGVCRRQQKLLLKAIEEAKDKGRYRSFGSKNAFSVTLTGFMVGFIELQTHRLAQLFSADV